MPEIRNILILYDIPNKYNDEKDCVLKQNMLLMILTFFWKMVENFPFRYVIIRHKTVLLV